MTELQERFIKDQLVTASDIVEIRSLINFNIILDENKMKYDESVKEVKQDVTLNNLK